MKETQRIAALAEPLEANLEARMVRIFPSGIPRPNLYLSIANNNSLFNHLVDIGFLGPSGLLDLKSLSKQLREVIILRTCISTRNHYEFNLHVQTISLIMGVSSEQIEDLKQERINTSLWSSELCAVVSLVDELVTCLDVSDNTFYKLRNYFDDAQLIEIVQLVGIYTGVAMLVALIRPKLDNYRCVVAH